MTKYTIEQIGKRQYTVAQGSIIQGVPYYSNLLTWHNSIDNLNFTDGGESGLNASIIPMCGWIDETNYLDVSHDDDLINQQQITYCAKIILPNLATDFSDATFITNRILGGDGFSIVIDRTGAQVDGNIRVIVDKGAVVVDELRSAALFDATEKDICVQIDLTGSVVKVFVNGIQAGANIDISGISDYFNTNGLRIGNANNPAVFNLKNTFISEISIVHGLVEESPVSVFAEKWTFCEGENSERVYGLVGHDAVWAGTGDGYKYHSFGNTWALLTGVSLYRDSSGNLTRVPYDYNGVAFSSPNVPAGYSLLADNIAGDSFNLANCLVDFDPNGTGNTDLDIFDKSNSVIHIATGSMNQYDSNYTHGWAIDEIKDPMAIRSYMIGEYKYRLYPRVETTGTTQPIITRFVELLSYNRELISEELFVVASYCNFDSFMIDATDYGAVFDGVTNDTAAILAAEAAFSAGDYYCVLFPAGTALVNQINIGGSVGNYQYGLHFIGQGETSIVKRTGAGPTALFSYGFVSDGTVKGILFDNDTIGIKSSFGVGKSENIYLIDIHFRNCVNSLATIYSCNGAVINDFTLLNIVDNGSGGNHGLDLDLTEYPSPEFINDSIVVLNGNLDNYGWDATKIENTKDYTLKDSVCYGRTYPTDDDKRLANCRQVLYDGNTFLENKKAGALNGVNAGTYMRDGNALIKDNVFEVELKVFIELRDLFYGCSIVHDAINDEITVTDIIIGNNAGDLATSSLWDIVNILNVGDEFTLPDATGFEALEFEVIELLGADSLKASITTAPTQIAPLSDVDVTYTRLNNPIIEITGNTFPALSYVDSTLQSIANMHDNIYLNGDTDP